MGITMTANVFASSNQQLISLHMQHKHVNDIVCACIYVCGQLEV